LSCTVSSISEHGLPHGATRLCPLRKCDCPREETFCAPYFGARDGASFFVSNVEPLSCSYCLELLKRFPKRDIGHRTRPHCSLDDAFAACRYWLTKSDLND
jgi:hypothetical protein